MSAAAPKAPSGPCARIILAVFGGLFLVALLSVPVTTRTSQLRRDPGSNVVFKTTYPENSSMFLLSYLAAKSRSGERSPVHLRSVQWVGTMALVALLGVFDYGLFCRLLRRSRRPEGVSDQDTAGEGAERPGRPSGLSLFP